MVEVTVKFMSIPRQRTGTGRVEFVSSGSKLRNVLKEIVDSYRIADIILTESGQVRPYARILVNGRSYQFIGGLDAELHDGDTVALIYPWIGHEDF
jgi:molybdopterin converting factor small subunit